MHDYITCTYIIFTSYYLYVYLKTKRIPWRCPSQCPGGESGPVELDESLKAKIQDIAKARRGGSAASEFHGKPNRTILHKDY